MVYKYNIHNQNSPYYYGDNKGSAEWSGFLKLV